jgi:hypothetical protein
MNLKTRKEMSNLVISPKWGMIHWLKSLWDLKSEICSFHCT